MQEQRKQQSPNKVLNTIKVLTCIRANSPVDVATICAQTGIALPTLYRAIKLLSDMRMIVEAGKDRSPVGRKAQLYAINHHYAYMLGVILEKNYVKAFVAGMDGRICYEREKLELQSGLTRQEIVGRMETAIDQVIAGFFPNSVGIESIDRIGVLSSPTIDVSAGKIIHFAGRDCLNGFEIVSYLQDKYKKSVKLMKVSAAEALSYSGAMQTKGVEQYLYIHIGQGVGACLVADGKIYEGKHSAAGEVESLFQTVADARNAPVVPFTAWQMYDMVWEYVKQHPRSVLAQLAARNTGKYPSRQRVIRHSVEEAIGMGDKDTIRLLTETVQKWADVIWILSVCYDPEVFIIGGEISEEVPHLFDWIRELVQHRSQCVLIPADAQITHDMVLVKSVLDDSFIDFQKHISDW